MALLGALVSVPIYYMTYRYAPQPKRQLSVTRYVLTSLLMGALAYVVGTVAGIAAACSQASAGNLCGLMGVFGVGPLSAAVAIISCAHRWVSHARRAP